MTLALSLFVLFYILMLAVQQYRPWVALGGAGAFLLLGKLGVYDFTLADAARAVDFNVLLMMAGMMGTVFLFIQSKMPARLAEELIAHVPDVRWAVSVLALLAGFISAFVDNVATVLMVAPVGLAIARRLKLSPVPVLIAIAVSSNLQGVGDSPQEVGPHLLRLALHPQLLLLFDAGGQGARHKGDHQHHHAGEDVLRDGEVEGKVGRAEREVDRQHADDRTGHAPPVAVGVHGNKKHRQQEHHRGHTVDAAADELDERHTGERPDERRQKHPDVLFPEHLLHLLSLPIYIQSHCKSIPQIN
jgi:hypothetical protein